MDTNNLKNFDEDDLIRVDVFSRPNFLNGMYTKLGIDSFTPPKILKIKADKADELLDYAQSQGKNVNNTELINEIAKEVHKSFFLSNSLIIVSSLCLIIFTILILF